MAYYFTNKELQDLKEKAFWCLEQLVVKRKSYKEIAKTTNKPASYWFDLLKNYKEKIWHIDEKLGLYHWLKLTGEIEMIIKDYVEKKETIMSIAKKYNCSERTIATFLQKENIKIRSRGFESRTDQSIFEKIDNEIKAYTIGLITADGSMSQNKKSISITLTRDDVYLLEQINESLFNGTGHIVFSKKKIGKDTATLQIHGKKMCSLLIPFGIVPNKTYLLKEISSLIPDSLYHHYLRGLFDGDGVCSKCRAAIRIGYCAHEKNFVKSYRDYFVNNFNFSKNKLFNTGNCWQVSWSSLKDLKKFYNYIYADATIFLGRKKNKIYTYINPEVT